MIYSRIKQSTTDSVEIPGVYHKGEAKNDRDIEECSNVWRRVGWSIDLSHASAREGEEAGDD